jgi:transcriptional regulator with XRE-family HTH domain
MTAEELRDLMKLHGWTQRDLARLLPLRTPDSTRIIRCWLSGKRAIRPLVAARIRSLAAESAGRRA